MTFTSVEFINSLIGYIMILVRLAVALRCGYLLLRMSQADDNSDGLKKKLINTIMFYVLAESVNQVPGIVEHYLK